MTGRKGLGVALGAVALIWGAMAGAETQWVHFPKGKHHATLSETLDPGAKTSYAVEAKRGEDFRVVFSLASGKCAYQVIDPNGSVVHQADVLGGSWEHKLKKPGEWRVRVDNPHKASCSYDVEIKLAFAEDLLDSLNALVARQAEQIEALGREVVRLKERLERAGTGDALGPFDPADEIPPHY